MRIEAKTAPFRPQGPVEQKAWKAAQSFEAQFLKSMLEQAFAGLSGEGPLGAAGPGSDTWRSFLIEEHAKSIAASGGVGVARPVYRSMMQMNAGQADVRI